MNENLIAKFQELKSKHVELNTEKSRYEAKLEQINAEIKSIQDKYSMYDLSTIESVEKIINDLTTKINNELNSIEEQYKALKMV